MRGKSVRKSLGLTSWEAAARKINELEIHGDNAVSVETAVDRWLDDCAARNLKPQSVRKYREVGKELKVKWAGYLVVSPTVDDVRKLREGWKYQGTTTQKRLELVRAFFSFCLASGWIQTNPGKMVKAPKVRLVPTLPYSDNEWKKILWALDAYGEIHEQSPVRVRKQLRALVLLLRYSGLRISDAVSLKRERVDSSGRLFVYTQKTGKPVYLPLPNAIIRALDEADEGNPYLFWPGGKLKTWITEWEERLQKVMAIAGIAGRGVAHRLRDTFSTELLKNGVPIETVAVILGNTVKVVEKHYSPWIEARQKSLEEAVRRSWASEPSQTSRRLVRSLNAGASVCP